MAYPLWTNVTGTEVIFFLFTARRGQTPIDSSMERPRRNLPISRYFRSWCASRMGFGEDRLRSFLSGGVLYYHPGVIFIRFHPCKSRFGIRVPYLAPCLSITARLSTDPLKGLTNRRGFVRKTHTACLLHGDPTRPYTCSFGRYVKSKMMVCPPQMARGPF